MSGPTVVQINANWPDLTPDQYDRLLEYGKTCVLAGAAAEGAPLRETIARLVEVLKEASESLGHMGAEHLKGRIDDALRAAGVKL